jgi:hypothetical protein
MAMHYLTTLAGRTGAEHTPPACHDLLARLASISLTGLPKWDGRQFTTDAAS